jgi:regulatory protein
MPSAQDHALKLLGHRARSEAELRRRLESKGFASEEIDQAIAGSRSCATGRRGARRVAGRDDGQAERKGPRLAVRKLEAAGIEEERAQAAVESAKGGASERELALKALERRRPALAPEAPRAERYKAARWLAAAASPRDDQGRAEVDEE